MSQKTKFCDLPSKDQQIVWTSNDILHLWRNLNQEDTEGRGWYEHRARQAYHDCLLSMKHNGLIEDYDCEKVQTKINGEWYADRRQLVFQPANKR